MNVNRQIQKSIVQILVPLVSDRTQQAALVSGAFFGSEILDQIQIGSVPRDFAIHLVTVCARFGVLEDGEHAISALLDEMRSRVGVEKQHLIASIQNQLCTDATRVMEVPAVQPNFSTTTALQINTPTLMRYFYDALESEDWERAEDLIDYLLQRPDLPHSFNAEHYQAQIRRNLRETSENQTVNNDYAILRVMAQHEEPSVVWEALLDFWDHHPGYDPDNLQVIGRDIEYERLKMYISRTTNTEEAWSLLLQFWDLFPDYDPDHLAVLIQQDSDGFGEAMRRIEEAHYKNIPELDLSDLDLRTIPPQIAYLKHLEKLNLSGNRLHTLPTEIYQLTALRDLSISNNQISALPPEVCNLRQLQILQANQNQLQALPACISQLKQLQRLHLQHNQLQTLPPEIGSLTALEMMDLGGNQITTLPGSMANLKLLMWLFLNENGMDELPSVVYRLSNIQWLFVHNNNLTQLSESIGGLEKLRWLSISYNQLQDLPLALGELRYLEHVAVKRGNPLRGIPHSIKWQNDRDILKWLHQRVQHNGSALA